jgi:hypothetical protein
MPEQAPLPYELRDVFFINICTKRAPVVPDALTLTFNIGVRIAAEQWPQLEVAIKIETRPEDQAVTFAVEVLATFEAVPAEPRLRQAAIVDFINQKSLPLMWPYADLMVRQLTAAMGVAPVKVMLPLQFEMPYAAAFGTEERVAE